MKVWLTLAMTLLFIAGCVSTTKHTQLQNKNTQLNGLQETNTSIPVQNAPKRNIKLKKVEDDNYSSEYMYPQTKSQPQKVTKLSQIATTSSVMGKEECIDMISQHKFDKYTQMFGSEAASIQRCAMLKAMN